MEPIEFTVSWQNAEGDERITSAEGLEALSKALAEEGYTGPTLKIYDELGFIVGWVSATLWWHA